MSKVKKKKIKKENLVLVDDSLLQRAEQYSKQKSLGQNFLVSSKILDQIVEISDINKEKDIVLEIGSGIGFLTERLVKKAYYLYAVELDEKTIPYLKKIQKENNNFAFIRKDILSLNLQQILSEQHFEEISSGKKNLKIVANIPYQISSKILLHFIGDILEESPDRKLIQEINILVQREFAEKLIAKPGIKAYGSLTVVLNYYTEIEACIEVPKEVFDPMPEVDSCFVKIKIKKEPLIEIKNKKLFKRFSKAIFANRRKKLANGLKAAGFSDEEIAKLDLEPNLRGETLSLEQMNSLLGKLL